MINCTHASQSCYNGTLPPFKPLVHFCYEAGAQMMSIFSTNVI